MVDLTQFWTDLTTFIDIILTVIALFVFYLAFKALSKLTLSGIIFIQLVGLALYISAVTTFIIFMITAFMTLYNKLFEFATWISDSFGSLNCMSYVLDCAGINNVMTLYFNELFALFVMIIFIRASFLFYGLWKEVNLATWRLGVLLGLV